LAQLYDLTGDSAKAMGLFERILRLDPGQVSIAITLGTYYAQRGRAPEAIRLWKDALSRNPGLTDARVNLAVAQFQSGDRRSAETTLLTALQYDPDAEIARRLLGEIRASQTPR
jgi:tetratricopeptide (TPR) repeat protein